MNLTIDRGDSGGPLMIEGNGKLYQIGVHSRGWNDTTLPEIKGRG